jgi:hypothetical protein
MYVKAVSALQQAVKTSAGLKGCILRGKKAEEQTWMWIRASTWT